MRYRMQKERGTEAYWVPISPIELVELSDVMRGAIRLAPVDMLQAFTTSVYDVESCAPVGIFEFLLDKSAGRIVMAFSRATGCTVDGQFVARIASSTPVWIPVTDVDKAAEALHDICRDSGWRTN